MRERIAWSQATFGPGARNAGLVAHIRKELIEIEDKPTDVVEWLDVVALALDGAWRAGATPEQIADALVAKHATNKNRMWPDWKNAAPDEPIEHIRGELDADRLRLTDSEIGELVDSLPDGAVGLFKSYDLSLVAFLVASKHRSKDPSVELHQTISDEGLASVLASLDGGQKGFCKSWGFDDLVPLIEDRLGLIKAVERATRMLEPVTVATHREELVRKPAPEIRLVTQERTIK